MFTQLRVPARRVLPALVLLFAIPFTAGAAAPVPRPTRVDAAALTIAPDAMAQDILSRHNQARSASGLSPFRRSAAADNVAMDRAQDMASKGYLAHYSPTGIGAANFLAQDGVSYRLLGENIGRANVSADQLIPAIHNAWMASRDHRDNIVDSRLNRVGIAVVSNGSMYYLAVVFLD